MGLEFYLGRIFWELGYGSLGCSEITGKLVQ